MNNTAALICKITEWVQSFLYAIKFKNQDLHHLNTFIPNCVRSKTVNELTTRCVYMISNEPVQCSNYDLFLLHEQASVENMFWPLVIPMATTSLQIIISGEQPLEGHVLHILHMCGHTYNNNGKHLLSSWLKKILCIFFTTMVINLVLMLKHKPLWENKKHYAYYNGINW